MALWKKLALGVAMAAGLMAGSGARAATTWIMASGYPEANFLTKNLRMFIEEVEGKSKGELKITLHSNDSLIKLDGIKRAVQTGQIQAGEIRLGVYGNEDPMFILDGTPFVASSYEDAVRLAVAQQPYFDSLFAKAGVKMLGYQIWPSQGFYTKTKVNSVDDFKGKKLRIYSTATQKMGALLGFNATILPFAEIPQAFSTGLIEALFTSAQTGVDIQAWDNTKFFTNVGAILSKNALIVNSRSMATLPKEVQEALVEAGAAYSKRTVEMSKAAHDAQAAVLTKNGMELSEAPPAIVETMKKVGVEMAADWKTTASPEAVAILDKYLAGN